MADETTMKEHEMKLSRRTVLKGAMAMSAAAVAGGFALNLAAPGSAHAAVKKLPKKWDET